MPTFEQKPDTATKKAIKDDGEYAEVLIEKHDKDADHLKMLAIHKKAVDSEIVKVVPEGTIVRFLKSKAKEHEASVHAKQARLARVAETIQPDQQFANISAIANNSVETVSHKELISG